MEQLDENLWLLRYPLTLLGADVRRNCSVIRLGAGELVIHSTAAFSPDDVAAIRGVGEPVWLVDAMLRHDTFAEQGRAMFPEATDFLAPPGFSKQVKFPTKPIVPAPEAWGQELQALEVAGAPSLRETVFLHAPSRTLIVCDLLFNFGPQTPLWTKALLLAAVGTQHHPGMSRPFKAAVKDKAAFRKSMDTVLGWDFDRIVVGHGDVIEDYGKEKLRGALQEAGF